MRFQVGCFNLAAVAPQGSAFEICQSALGRAWIRFRKTISAGMDMAPFSKPMIGLAVAACLAACAQQEQEPDVSAERGERLYFQKCAVCHGDDGKGAGDASLGLGAPPPDLTTLSAQNRGIFPQNYVMSVIDGFNRRNHPASAMPEFGEENLGPTIQVEDGGLSTPIPADLLALAAYLETIQQ